MTQEEAIRLAESEWWKTCTPTEIVERQLYEDRCIMPFGDFCITVNVVFGRSVYTHEFAKPELLRAEFEGLREKPTLGEIVNQLPNGSLIALAEEPSMPRLDDLICGRPLWHPKLRFEARVKAMKQVHAELEAEHAYLLETEPADEFHACTLLGAMNLVEGLLDLSVDEKRREEE